MTTNQKAQTAIETMKNMKLEKLIDLWNTSETQEMTTELATVRGWMMEAFEAKNPEAFDKWIENSDKDDRVEIYFLN